MDPLGIFGINAPLFVVLTLLLSYLLWAKFVNRGNITPQNVDDFFAIIIIFIITLAILVGLSYFWFLLFNYFQRVDGMAMWLNNTPLFVSFLSGAAIVLIALYFNEKTTENLKKIYVLMMCVYFLFNGFVLGTVIILQVFSISYQLVLLMSIIIFLLLVAVLSLILPQYFQFKMRNSWKYIVGFFILGLTIGLLYGYINFTNISYGEEKIISYDVYNNIPYANLMMPLTIIKIGSFNSWIPFNYAHYGLNISNGENKNLGLSIINQTSISPIILTTNLRSGNLLEQYGFKNPILDDSENTLVLSFNSNEVKKKEVKSIIFNGHKKVELNKTNYSYEDNNHLSELCTDNGCIVSVSVSNNLELPLNFYHIPFPRTNSYGKSCIFERADIVSEPSQNEPFIREGDLQCTGKMCYLIGKNDKINKLVVTASINDEGILILDHINVYPKTEIQFWIRTSCS